MSFNPFWSSVLEFIYPPRCMFCRKIILPGKTCCETCESALVPCHWNEQIIEPQSKKTLVCMAPDEYNGALRKAMISFKFHNKPKQADFFAQRMVTQLEQSSFLTRADGITSVPLSRERMRQRGYNQSELIAREIAVETGLTYSTLLEKNVENLEQHRLHKKDRQENVRGVYRLIPGNSVQDKRILLVDDILTTGATLRECAFVLYSAGAQEVVCAAACRVPSGQESFSS